MNPKFVCAAIAAAGLAAAGCGSRSADFKSGFATSQTEFRKLGTDLAKDITGAGAKTDIALAAEFRTLATRAGHDATQLARLHPPARYKRRMASLIAGFHRLSGDLSAISSAATKHDAASARTATRALLRDAATIKAADTALSRSLGLPASTGARGSGSATSSTSSSSSG